MKTVQGLLRHANSRITLDVYTQAVNSTKRAAQSKVVRMMVQDMGKTDDANVPADIAIAGLLYPLLYPDFAVTVGRHSF
ncbi:MAG: hypothetical protein ACYDC6_13685 [Acidobacteriaceae bacterium]